LADRPRPAAPERLAVVRSLRHRAARLEYFLRRLDHERAREPAARRLGRPLVPRHRVGRRGGAGACGRSRRLRGPSRPDPARPAAMVYARALPIAALLSPATWRDLGGAARRLAAHAVAFGAVFAPYLLFRRLYFGAWLPNTYYAKDHPSLAFLVDRDKWAGLL